MNTERLSLDKIQLELETFYNFVILKLKSHYNLLTKYIFPKLKNQHLPKTSLIKKSRWKNISHFSHVMFNLLLTILIVQSKSCLQLLTYTKKFVSLIKMRWTNQNTGRFVLDACTKNLRYIHSTISNCT